jgi:chromosome segregation ATPase
VIHIADGTLKFDTKIDKEGFNSGIKTIKGSLNSFLGSLKGLGSKFSSVFNDTSSVDRAGSKITDITRNISELEMKMKELASQQIPTDEYVQMEQEIQKTDNKLLSLLNRQEKLQALGADTDSKQWKSLQYDIDTTSNKLDRLEKAFERLKASGNGHILGKDTEEYQKMQNKVGKLNEELIRYKAGLNKADSGQKKVSSSANKASKSVNKLGKSASNGRMSMLSMLKMSLLFSVTFQALSGAINAVVTGFQNLVNMTP